MQQQLCHAVIYLILCLSFSKLSCTGADDAIAQSNVKAEAAATSELSKEASETAPFLTQRIKRRYIPRFIGKRIQDSNAIDMNEIPYEKTYSDVKDELTELDEAKLLELFDKYGETEIIDDTTGIQDEEEIDDVDTDEYLDDDNDTLDDSLDIERRRYVPSFIGKRRYNPMFVGKRYNPMFVGKKYSPMFVGKRYIPRFVGKRYIPRFVGKRYRPMFIGKRGSRSPMFIGKRYNPMFVGKRYKPMFIGKKDKLIPRFIGKRSSSPMLVSESRAPMFLGKRSVQENDQLQASGKDNTKEIHSRKRRSLMEEDDNDFKRAWGTYIPWQDTPTYKMLQSAAAPDVDKRFVAPEFIGRRDSLSSLLSALKALRYARNEPRIASKRFQAPLFIGKRDMTASEDNDLLKYYRVTPLGVSNNELLTALQEMSGRFE